MKRMLMNVGFKLITLGFKPINYLDGINDYLRYGRWLKKYKFEKLNPPRENLYDYINNTVLKNCEIDYIEFGVYKGESIKNWTSTNNNISSRFYGFDWFYGLPEEWVSTFNKYKKGRGEFSTNGEMPNIEDERVEFVQGLFQESLPRFLKTFHQKNRLVIHLDADLYNSTLYVLTKLNDFLVKDTILIFDEFASASHEFRAFNDYCSSYNREYEPIAACLPHYTKMAILLK